MGPVKHLERKAPLTKLSVVEASVIPEVTVRTQCNYSLLRSVPLNLKSSSMDAIALSPSLPRLPAFWVLVQKVNCLSYIFLFKMLVKILSKACLRTLGSISLSVSVLCLILSLHPSFYIHNVVSHRLPTYVAINKKA